MRRNKMQQVLLGKVVRQYVMHDRHPLKTIFYLLSCERIYRIRHTESNEKRITIGELRET